ncbi:hybrid sensor histidine kinase/response regulator [Alienimonas californiensis]|uniref:histidine kinase n=1 Tax=Alienimonas californiensis TaxID=2527989 RepID=A0A517PCH7_9PLAN|nr:ATP-binding protein [Alienimonas californiensis]QDT17088.1 Blue-light-activated protein [Alienimonas californiensis]
MGTDPTEPPAPPPPAPGRAAHGRAADRQEVDGCVLQSVLNELPQRVFWRTADGRYLGCNRAFAEDAGVARPEEVAGRTDEELPWPAGPIQGLRSDDAALLADAQPEAIVVEAATSPRGGERWLEIRKAPLRDDHGAIVGVVGTYADSTARRLAEARLRVLGETIRRRSRRETLGALTGGVAQEFRHLLDTISRHAGAPDRGAATPELVADLERIRAAADRASTLTHRLLNLSRQPLAAPTTLDPREELCELLSLIRPLFGDQIDLRFNDVPEPPGTVHADRAELQQALLNLCLYARDAMEARGGGRLTLAARRVPADVAPPEVPAGDFVRFEVSDTGPGVPAAIRDQMFDPFVTARPPARSTGLGMAVVQGVAEHHGGRVTLDTTPTGTNVGLELPAASPPPSEGEPSEASRTVTGEAGRPALRALVVDDHVAERLVTARGLTKQGFECRTAQNGREALELLDAGLECDVVVTDLQMPELNGRALCRKLLERPRRPGLIVLSGSLDARLHEGLEELGVDRLFFKPMGSRELARAAAEVVAARAAS